MRGDDERVSNVMYLPTSEDVKAGILEAIHERGDALDERLGHVLFTMRDLAARWGTDETTAGAVAELAAAYFGGLMVTTEGAWLFTAEPLFVTESVYPALKAGGCAEVRAMISQRLTEEAAREGYELRLAH